MLLAQLRTVANVIPVVVMVGVSAGVAALMMSQGFPPDYSNAVGAEAAQSARRAAAIARVHRSPRALS